MAIASGMRELTRDIASSRKDRAERIEDLREVTGELTRETMRQLRSLRAARRQEGDELQQTLARDRGERTAEVGSMLRDARQHLDGYVASHHNDTIRMRRSLKKGTSARKAEVGQMTRDARQHRQHLGVMLRNELGKATASRKSGVTDLLESASGLVQGFQARRKTTGGELRKGLSQSRADTAAAVRELRAGFHEAQEAVAKDLKEASAAWKGLSRPTPARSATIRRAAKEKKTDVPVGEEKAADLETQLLAAIKEHPEGIPLSAVAESLGVASIVLGRASKSLIDGAKIRKEDKLYFPIN